MTASQDRPFIVIGENMHTSRIVLRKGKRFSSSEGTEGVLFSTLDEAPGLLPVSDEMRATKAYDEGRVKHIALALSHAMDAGPSTDLGFEYLNRVISDQVRAGADFLDVNVDEFSIYTSAQRDAMKWLVEYVASMTELPISVDSSDLSVINTGLSTARRVSNAPPMLNSASLERAEAVDLAVEYQARVVVTAAGAEGMPSSAEERIDNASQMVDNALAAGLSLGDLYVDPLVFPISVDGTFGLHTLDAIRVLRERFGSEIHITGGMSNVSFGIPARKLMNAVFINLAVEAGADSGIIDPVMNPPDTVFALDKTTEPYQLAQDTLLGRDEMCMNYIMAWRKGRLDTSFG